MTLISAMTSLGNVGTSTLTKTAVSKSYGSTGIQSLNQNAGGICIGVDVDVNLGCVVGGVVGAVGGVLGAVGGLLGGGRCGC